MRLELTNFEWLEYEPDVTPASPMVVMGIGSTRTALSFDCPDSTDGTVVSLPESRIGKPLSQGSPLRAGTALLVPVLPVRKADPTRSN